MEVSRRRGEKAPTSADSGENRRDARKVTDAHTSESGAETSEESATSEMDSVHSGESSGECESESGMHKHESLSIERIGVGLARSQGGHSGRMVGLSRALPCCPCSWHLFPILGALPRCFHRCADELGGYSR